MEYQLRDYINQLIENQNNYSNISKLQNIRDMINVMIGYTLADQLIYNEKQRKEQSENQNIVSANLLTEGADMKGITKRDDGRYMIRKMINGQTITKYTRTLEDAKFILQKIKKGKIKPVNKIKNDNKQQNKNIIFNEYTNLWLEKYKKPFVSKKSFYEITRIVSKFINVFGKWKMKDITTNDIQDYLNNLPITRTKEKICTYFNSILQKAVDTRFLNYNPFALIVKDKKIKCKNDAYTFAEQEKILNAIKGTDIEHEIMIYLMCGCRPNELPNKNCFDFENNIINIYGTKNENAKHRQIEMSQNFSNYIKEYFKTKDTQPEKYVTRKFNELCKNVGIKKPLLYRLRHTFATNHFTLETQPKLVQHWLGHSTISMTLDTYTDIDKTATKEKIVKLYNNFYYQKN